MRIVETSWCVYKSYSILSAHKRNTAVALISCVGYTAIYWSIIQCLFTDTTNASESIVMGTEYIND